MDLVQTSAIAPQIFRALRERILRADLMPGALLSETEIARSHGVSRQPVREAFIKLAEAGLVRVRPQRRTMVTRISEDAVTDARFVREAIEADIVRLVASKAERADLVERLRAQIAAQAQVDPEDAQGFMRLDERFHRTLAEAAGRPYAWRVIEEIKAQMDRVRHLSLERMHTALLIRQHTGIVDAIAAGDPDAAERGMRAHLREILATLRALALSKPELFAQTAPDEKTLSEPEETNP